MYSCSKFLKMMADRELLGELAQVVSLQTHANGVDCQSRFEPQRPHCRRCLIRHVNRRRDEENSSDIFRMVRGPKPKGIGCVRAAACGIHRWRRDNLKQR